MAKVKSFKAEIGVSLTKNDVWYKFYSGIELEIEEGDNVDDVKRRAWNTVSNEVEKQIQEVMSK